MLNFSREIIKNSQLQFVPTLLKEKQFNDSVEGVTIFIEKKIQDGEYENIFIRDEGKILSGNKLEPSTIIAKYGRLGKDEISLVLFDGNIQRLNKNGKINIIKFKKTTLNFSGLTTKSITEPKIQETSTLRIFNCLRNKNVAFTHNCSREKKSLMDNKIELNKRFGMPIYIPLISLICTFLLASRKDKKTYSYNKYIYFFACFLILVFSEILVRYSGLSWNHTAIYYLLPMCLLPLFYFTLIRKFKYENLN
jgi:lipopolysaccharide export system permease protein